MAKAIKPLLTVVGAAVGFVTLGPAGIFVGAYIGNSLGNSAKAILAPKVKAPATSPSSEDRLTANIDLRTPRKIVVGSTAMATDIRDQEWSADQSYLDRFIVVASHRVQAIREIWFDDKLAWSAVGGIGAPFAGYLTVTPVLEGSAANAIFTSGRMSASRRFTGCAYVHLRYKLTGNGKKAESPFATTIPSRMTIVGDGLAVYDPRLDSTAGGAGPQRANDQSTWAWTESAGRNPSLQLLTYLLGWRINGKLAVGKGLPAARIDVASFMTAANLCDEPVARSAGGTEPRYRADGIFSEGDDLRLVLDNFKAAMNAELDDADGRIRISILYNDLANPRAALGAADVLGDFTWDQTEALSDTVNIMRGGYTDASATSLYQMVDYPEVRIAAPDGIDRVETVNLPLVQSASQAQRLVKLKLQRALYAGTFTAVFQATAWRYQKGDIVPFTFPPLGFAAKLFRIAEMTIQVDGTVPMTLREEHPSMYAWDASDAAPVVGAAPTTYQPNLWPIAQGIADAEAQIAAVLSDNVITHGREKRELILQWNGFEAEFLALDARYAALGSPTNMQQARTAAFAAYTALAATLAGFTPAWDNVAVDTPINGADLNAQWSGARARLEEFAAAITGQPGKDGLSAYNAVLDNETHTLPADAAGNVTSYAGAEFTVQILYGSTDVTSSFHLDSVDNPQDLFGPDLYPTYRIDGGLDAAEDAAVVTYGFRGNAGSPHANVLLTKAFSLAKSKGGLDGSAPPLISMSASSSVVKYSAADVMTTGDITMVTVRSNTAGTPRFTLTSFDGTVHGVANAEAQQLKDTFGDQVFGTTGPDVLILRAGWLNTIMQSFGGGLRVAVGIAGGSDTVTIIKVRDGVKGDNAPALTVTPAVSQLLVGKDGNYVGGQSFSLNVTRVELSGVPRFRRSDGYTDTAAGFAQADPASFSTTGPDNLTISPAGAVANMEAFGGTAGRLTFGVLVPGSAVTATATIQKVRDGVAGADGFIADSDAPVFVIECYSNGTPKPSWTGGRGSIRLTKGGGIITAGVTYSVSGQQNIASLALDGSTFSFAGLTADTGQFIINAIYNGVAYSRVISVKKVRDGSAAFRSEATFSANSNAASGTGNTTVPQARTVTISGYASYFAKSPGPGQTFGAVGYLSLFWRNVTDNGPDNLLGTVQGSEARTVNRSGNAAEPDYDAIGGQVAGAFQFTSPSPDKQIAYRAEFSSNGSAGSVYGSVALEIL